METIKVRCSRCASKYEVSAEKAGHRGKCPRCGGIMRVPTPRSHSPAPQKTASPPTSAGRVLAVIALVCVLVAAGIFLALRLTHRSAAEGPPSAEEQAAAEKLRQVDRDIAALTQLDRRMTAYDELVASERRLHAREIEGKKKTWELVTAEEHALREEVLTEQRDLRINPTGASWQLDVPLDSTEKAEHLRQIRELQDQAREMQQTLMAAGITIPLITDSFGRTLLDRSAAAKAIALRREELEVKRMTADQELKTAGGARR